MSNFSQIAVDEKKELIENENIATVHMKAISEIKENHVFMNVAGSNKNVHNDNERQKAVDVQTQKTNNLMTSLGANDGLKSMLVAQMAAVHELQQFSSALAKRSKDVNEQSRSVKNATMLSTVFVQQASLLHKLQGNGQQKVVVEHVHVYAGGQAVVGNVSVGETRGGCGGGELK